MRPVDWQSAPFGRLQPLPSNRQPVSLWPNQDAAFADIAQGIRQALVVWRSQTPADNLPKPAKYEWSLVPNRDYRSWLPVGVLVIVVLLTVALAVWLVSSDNEPKGVQETSVDCSPAVSGVNGNVTIISNDCKRQLLPPESPPR